MCVCAKFAQERRWNKIDTDQYLKKSSEMREK